MIFPTLYGKDSSGGLKLWEVFTQNEVIVVRHGKLNGKIQEKRTTAVPMNVGRSNATTASEQADTEALAKWTKQKKKGYFEDKEEALGFVTRTPMKAQNFNDYSHKVKYPCYIQPKLNGQRMLIDSEGNCQSKQGESIELPEPWKEDIKKLVESGLMKDGIDGEIFSGHVKQGGLSLQQIISAFRKPNENTQRLFFALYDVCSDGTQEERVLDMIKIKGLNLSCILGNIETIFIETPEGADAWYAEWLEQGAEGMVYRNLDGKYEYGKRSYNLIKRKPRLDAEAKVVGCVPDKNNAGLLSCVLQNGVEFKCLMRVDSHPDIDYRKFDNANTLLGTFITFEYEELSDDGVPTKPVGVGLRKMNENWEPLE